MSTRYFIFNNTTPFTLKNGNSKASIDEIWGLIYKHMDDYQVSIEEHGDGVRFTLEFDGSDAGDTFPGRVRALVKDMSDHVADAFMVQVRDDGMNDDRDENIFGGPNEDAIDRFRQDYYLSEAMALLKSHSPRYYSALQDVMSGRLCRPEDVRVISVIEGGALQSVVSTHPVSAYKIDYDTQGCEESELVDIPQGAASPGRTQKALVGKEHVMVLPDECDGVVGLIDQHAQRVSEASRPHAA